jgi:small subunit ribosomal protein S6
LTDLNNQEVEILKTGEAGDRDLAYEIKKRKRGRYVLFILKTEQSKITALDRAFKLNANLLKYLFIRTEEEGEAHG